MCFGIWDQKRSSSWKKREILASFNGCLFQSQTPESNTEHCPGFVLSLAGCRLAMLTLAMWLCASAFRVAQWKRVWMLRTLRFINIRNETTKSTQIINVVILKKCFLFFGLCNISCQSRLERIGQPGRWQRVSRVLLVCMDARKTESHSSQRIPVKDLNLAHQWHIFSVTCL